MPNLKHMVTVKICWDADKGEYTADADGERDDDRDPGLAAHIAVKRLMRRRFRDLPQPEERP